MDTVTALADRISAAVDEAERLALAVEAGLRAEVDHVASWPPAVVLRHVQHARNILTAHANGGSSQGWFGPFGEYGDHDPCCQACGSFGEYGVTWPCAEIASLAGAWGIT